MRSLFLALSVCFFSNCFSQMQFHWRQISGPVQTNIIDPDSAKTQVNGLYEMGIYEFELSVTNDFGAGLDTCAVTVTAGTLDIKKDSVFHLRPVIKTLEIKTITRASDIFVQIKSPKFQQLECALYDLTGRKLAHIILNVKQGTNYLTIPKPAMPGIYVIRFLTYFESVTQKVVI